MRILIAGAGGQLGWDLQQSFGKDELHAFDHGSLDVVDRRSVRRTVERIAPHWIINAAAFNDVDGAESTPKAAFAVNVAGAGNLAEAAAAVNAAMLHISTDYVFDGLKGSPYIETDTPNPLSIYGQSKYEGELQVLAAGRNTLVVRTAWLYGSHGKNFVKAVHSAAMNGEPLRVVADQTGSPTSTADLARAIHELVQTDVRGLLHVVNSGSCTRHEFAEAVVRRRVEVQAITTAEAHRPARRPPNTALASERWGLTGMRPLRGWRAALDEFMASTYPT